MKHLLLIIALFTTNTHANMASKVAAIVGEDIISVHDLKKRMQLIVNSQPEPISVGRLSQLITVALNELIDEKVAFKEAQKLKITLSEPEIKTAIANISKDNNLTEAELKEVLKARHLSLETLQEQVRGKLIKDKIIIETIVPHTSLTEKEIYEKFAQMHPERVQLDFKIISVNYNNKNFDDQKRILTKLKSQLSNCNNAEQIVKAYPSVKIETHKNALTKLPSLLKNELQNHNINQPTRLMKSPSIIKLAIICHKEYVNFSEQEKLLYYNNLIHEKIMMQANTYLTKLRKQAHIEIREENLQNLEFAPGTINVVP